LRELAGLALRTLPAQRQTWVGASAGQLAALEEIAGRPLPPFYRWFQQTMGGSMGPLAYQTLDFSAAKILACHEEGLVSRDPRYLLIAHESDALDGTHLFYDLDAPARGDALVVSRAADEDAVSVRWETLREMLAWGVLLHHGVRKQPRRCEGDLSVDAPELVETLDPLMARLGFVQPLATGRFCRLYEHPAGTPMVLSRTPGESASRRLFFELGGPDTNALRNILGAIATQSPVRVDIRAWVPPLR
jgi:hypothetical protein